MIPKSAINEFQTNWKKENAIISDKKFETLTKISKRKKRNTHHIGTRVKIGNEIVLAREESRKKNDRS